jgi:hypothetical protein
MASAAQERPISRAAGIAVMAVWILAIGLTGWLAMRYLW